MSEDVPEKPPGGVLLLYRTEDGRTRLECRFEEGTIWLSQALIAELFSRVSRLSQKTQNRTRRAVYLELSSAVPAGLVQLADELCRG
jgi:hypothetical protein